MCGESRRDGELEWPQAEQAFPHKLYASYEENQALLLPLGEFSSLKKRTPDRKREGDEKF